MNSDKLTLNYEMKRSHLIQRLDKPLDFFNPFSFGAGLKNGGLSDKGMKIILKNIFSFDYMGSTEFEGGVVPAALDFIAEQKDSLTSGIHLGVYYICPGPYEEGVKAVITTLLEDERSLRLKENCGLSERINNPQDDYRKDNDGWLELDNGFFFFIDKEMFENTKRLFGIK